MKNGSFAVVMLAGLTAVGCTAATGEPEAARSQGAVAQAAARAPAEALDRDGAAARQYAQVQQAFAERRAANVHLAAYALEPVGNAAARADARARALGLRGGAVQRADGSVVVADGDRELRVDAASGTERFVDLARFHRGQGVSALPLAEADYVSRAREHVLAVMPDTSSVDLRAYKVRRYMNDSAGPGGQRTGETIYQVAVAFNQFIDGVPVIGPGGKVAVHMTPGGEVLSHETTVRPVAQRLAAVSGAEMVEPEAARRQVEERLVQRGVRMADYTLTRAELGYLRLGRHGVQSVVVPHYAFFYEPISRDVVGKKLVETIPAVTSPAILGRLHQDEQAEAQRLAVRHANAAKEDIK